MKPQYLYRLTRAFGQKHIEKYGHYITGKTIDVGAGEYSRYAHHLRSTEIVKLDFVDSGNTDVVAKADQMPFPNDSFDSALCTQVLEHVPDPQAVMHEIYRVLKPGGYLLLTVPQSHCMHEEPHDYYRYTKYGLTHLADTAGFTIIALEPMGGFFCTVTQTCMTYLKSRFTLNQSRYTRLYSYLFKKWGSLAIWLDTRDHHPINRANTIGWTLLIRK